MSSIEIKKIGITKLDTDAVVNAANTGLWEGSGVCGFIFRDAGSDDRILAAGEETLKDIVGDEDYGKVK